MGGARDAVGLDDWQEVYRDGQVPWCRDAVHTFLQRILKDEWENMGLPKSGARLIDVGCGTGVDLVWMSQHLVSYRCELTGEATGWNGLRLFTTEGLL